MELGCKKYRLYNSTQVLSGPDSEFSSSIFTQAGGRDEKTRKETRLYRSAVLLKTKVTSEIQS